MQARQDPDHSVLALMHEPPDRSPMMVAADRSPASGSGSRFEPPDPSLIYFLAVPSGLTGLVPLGPMPPRSWEYTYSTDIIKKIMNERMYPTTVQGLTDAMKALTK